MTTLLTVEQAAEILRSAFRPLICGAEVFDYGEQKLRFQVLGDNGQTLWTGPEMLAVDATNRRYLSDQIEHARRHLESKGVTLDAWTFPGEEAS